MSETRELENKSRVAELARKTSAQKRSEYQQGSPISGSIQETLSKLGNMQDMFSSFFEAKAFHRLSEVLELAKSNLETKSELNEFNVNLSELNGSFNDVMVILRNVDKSLDNLVKTLNTELSKQQSQRELETTTLTKLNKYLENWL